MRPNDWLRKHRKFIRPKEFNQWMHVIMSTYGLSLKEFKELPIPVYYSLIEQIYEENERMKGSTKRKRR